MLKRLRVVLGWLQQVQITGNEIAVNFLLIFDIRNFNSAVLLFFVTSNIVDKKFHLTHFFLLFPNCVLNSADEFECGGVGISREQHPTAR